MAIALLESTREALHIEEFLYRELQKHWAKSLVNVRERVRLVPDLYKFRADGDPYFYAQSKGKIPRHYSVYFDNEYVCNFDSEYLPQGILLVFWRGLLKLYEEHKIYFDKRLYKVDEEIAKDNEKTKKHQRKEQIRRLKAPAEVKEIISHMDEENEGGKK